VSVPSPEVSAANLFRRANAARRASDLAGARSLYTELEAKYPSSDEAKLARVSLGKLLLSSGGALEAERQFSQYLAQGSSELTEEALVGRAESLKQLGRAADERQDWRRLVRDFPSSVYTERAKRRLEELDSRLP
jgi:TolA-binding protein